MRLPCVLRLIDGAMEGIEEPRQPLGYIHRLLLRPLQDKAPVWPVAGLPEIFVITAIHAEIVGCNHRNRNRKPVPSPLIRAET